MNYLLAVASEVPISVHEWSQTVSVVTVLWAVIITMGCGLLWYALADRSSIKTTLDRLVEVVEDLRIDLADNYAKKADMERLSNKVDKLREHLTLRGGERRIIEDSEDG